MLIAGPFARPVAAARFLLEAESVAALEHPHIVRVFAFGEHGGHPYLAMEFLPGGTLAERIKTNGPLPAKDATELVAKLAAAVAHAHSRGVVHRDIKPLNVLLTAEGEPRLTDFGLAKVGRADQNLSVTGQVLGTPAYMAPEQAAGKVHEVGTAADVYALGAVLYDVLTGRPPFVGDSAAVTLQKVLTEEPQRPRKLNASIPRDLETICLKCLEKDPAKRYPTAQALADDLLRYLRERADFGPAPVAPPSVGSLVLSAVVRSPPRSSCVRFTSCSDGAGRRSVTFSVPIAFAGLRRTSDPYPLSRSPAPEAPHRFPSTTARSRPPTRPRPHPLRAGRGSFRQLRSWRTPCRRSSGRP